MIIVTWKKRRARSKTAETLLGIQYVAADKEWWAEILGLVGQAKDVWIQSKTLVCRMCLPTWEGREDRAASLVDRKAFGVALLGAAEALCVITARRE